MRPAWRVRSSPAVTWRIGISKTHSAPWAMSGTGERGDTGIVDGRLGSGGGGVVFEADPDR